MNPYIFPESLAGVESGKTARKALYDDYENVLHKK